MRVCGRAQVCVHVCVCVCVDARCHLLTLHASRIAFLYKAASSLARTDGSRRRSAVDPDTFSVNQASLTLTET